MDNDKRLNDGFERLAKVESKADSAHKRIDEVEASDKRIWSRVRDNEAKYMDAVPKAHSAHDGMLEMGVTLNHLVASVEALHRRNDEKDIADKVAYSKFENTLDRLALRITDKDLSEAEERGARKLKATIIAWASTILFGMIVSLFVWLIASINELKVENAKLSKTEKVAVKKEDQTADSEDNR